MDEPSRYTHRLYLHPSGEWTPDPDDATLRLDATLRVRHSAEASNRLYSHDSKSGGGWAAVEDESAFSATERGFVWFGWPTMAGGQQYLAFKGVRVLDEQIAQLLLEDLTVHNEDGVVLEEREAAGHIFLLDVADAKSFNKRVKNAGGVVHRGDPMPDAARDATESIEKCGAAMEQLTAEDGSAVSEAIADNFSGRSAFERRREPFDTQMQRARAAFDDCERALRPLALPGRSLAEQAQAVAMSERATRAIALCGSLYERREAAERELARLIAHAEGGPPPEESRAQRLLLLREVGRIARANGLETEETPEGVRVRTRHGWLRLGPGFDFEP